MSNLKKMAVLLVPSLIRKSMEQFLAPPELIKHQQSIWRPDRDTLLQTQRTLERILTENILSFWYPQVVDTKDGGYRLNHDLEGRWRGPATKHLVTQARTVWFFSRLVSSDYATPEYLVAATHGYEFLRDRMWDREFGGFYWEVDSSGRAATRPDKHTYGQAFGLYALTEYAVASGDLNAKAAAEELFTLMETKAHDKEHGGYREIFKRDWSPVPTRAASRLNDPASIKRMNTHIHLMEAITTFIALSGETTARERLIELILVNSNSVVRKNIGACTDQYLENWEPLQGPNHDRVSYGHDVENIWLLVEACKAAGISPSLSLDLYRTLFNYALQYGFDRRDGGFYDSGPLNGPADRHQKIWWVQAEGLVAALQMYGLTREQVYWRCFSQTLEWLVKRQVHWEHGDWYEPIDQNGRASGLKAGPWKCPYHNGRAMLQCLDLLACL
jgi:mannose/cellobiose epimerase-like protein (N-acyl-D-glucosamine 2-epimerase family)